MIIKKAYTSKEKSIYRCDRCKRTLVKDLDQIYYVTARDVNENKQIASWHLCERDYKSLEKGIDGRKTNE